MGAESSSLKNCHLQEALEVSSEQEWQLHHGKTGDGSPVSVFVYKKAVQNKDLIENAAKNLKVLRHPCIVKFLGWTKSNDGHRLITEPVIPLELQLDTLTPLEVCAGLHDVIQALSFLHDRGEFCHNNVSISSIFVSEDGTWKLGCMEHVCRYEEVTLDRLKASASSRDAKAISPEEKSGNILSGSDIGHSRDVYAFGIVVEQVYEYLSSLGRESEWFGARVQEELLNDDPKQRPKLGTFLKDPIFQNDFVAILSFLKNITVKSEAEKNAFFGNVVEKLHRLPAELVARRLTRLLLSRFVLLDQSADKELAPHFLHPCQEKRSFQSNKLSPILPKGLFQKFVIPELFKIFHVRDCHVRLVILRHFAAYVGLFDKTTLQSVILPQVLIGLRDNHDDLVSASLHALAEMVPILGAEIVVGSNRHAVFKEGKPKFQTMNGSAINYIDKQKELFTPAPDKIAGVQPMNHESEHKNGTTNIPLKVVGMTLKDQAKENERQKRREEARKRMEERRKRREDRRNTLKGKEKDEESSDTISQQSLSPHHQTDTAFVTSVEAAHKNSDTYLPSPVSDDESHCSTAINQKGQIPDPIGEKNSSTDDEDIDKAIENEINAMDSTLSPKEMNRIKALNEVVVADTDPDITVDWSDVSRNKLTMVDSGVSTKGVLKLKSSKKKHPVVEESGTSHYNSADVSWSNSADSWDNNEWDSTETSPRKVSTDKLAKSDYKFEPEIGNSSWNDDSWTGDSPTVEIGVLNVTESVRGQGVGETKNKNSYPKKVQPRSGELGSEFDIKSISVSKKQTREDSTDPLDFFADMEPVIKTSPLTQTTSAKIGETSDKSTVSFDMVVDNMPDASGWGEDLEWGEEDNWS